MFDAHYILLIRVENYSMAFRNAPVTWQFLSTKSFMLLVEGSSYHRWRFLVSSQLQIAHLVRGTGGCYDHLGSYPAQFLLGAR